MRLRPASALQYSGYGGDWVQLVHNEDEEKATMLLDGKFFRAVKKNCWNVEERLKEMDETGRCVGGRSRVWPGCAGERAMVPPQCVHG